MQLIDKNEKEMTPQEKLRLEVMRTIAVGRGFNLRSQGGDFDFRTGSNFFKMAEFIVRRFNVSYKDKADATKFWNEGEVVWEGKSAQKATAVSQPTAEKSPDITGEDGTQDESAAEAEAMIASAEAKAAAEENEQAQTLKEDGKKDGKRGK